jgi:hypothetical protein
MKTILIFVFLISTIFTAGLAGLPWWVLAIPAALTGLLQNSHKRAFLDAFFAAFLVWAFVAIAQDVTTGMRISPRVAGVFHLPFSVLAFAMTGLIAGLVAGVAATCGQALRKLMPASAYIPGGR